MKIILKGIQVDVLGWFVAQIAIAYKMLYAPDPLPRLRQRADPLFAVQ